MSKGPNEFRITRRQTYTEHDCPPCPPCNPRVETRYVPSGCGSSCSCSKCKGSSGGPADFLAFILGVLIWIGMGYVAVCYVIPFLWNLIAK
jgi:hypothetical protein